METKIRRLAPTVAFVAAIIFLTFCQCSSLVESRPRRTTTGLQEIFPNLIVPSQYFDYSDYTDIELSQGTRRRRWAFPAADIQEGRCPVGQKLHSSGYGCVPEKEGDDY